MKATAHSQSKNEQTASAVTPSTVTAGFVDSRPETVAQRRIMDMMNGSPRVNQLRSYTAMMANSPRVMAQRRQMVSLVGGSQPQARGRASLQGKSAPETPPAQLQTESDPAPNRTGLPDHLKAGVESLSGLAMDDVRVHYGSPKPAQLQALAYTQGTEIHVGPGQEQHLAHEAWHVVQQKQGRVRPTMQMKDGVPVNDDAGLEREADVMGIQALQTPRSEQGAVKSPGYRKGSESGYVVQHKISIDEIIYPDDETRREFNRTLMLSLKKHHYKELGTKAMWDYVTKQLDRKKLDDDTTFDSWEDYLNVLWEKGLLERTQRGTSMGPKNLGTRPSFTKETEEAIELEKGQHRRHIISSSSLGKGIETAHKIVKEQQKDNTLTLLNQWIKQEGGDECQSEYEALRTIWSMVHNHTGNLFAGEGAANSAIGFIRSPLKKLLDDLDKNKTNSIKVEGIVKEIESIKPTMAWLKERWVEITESLKERIRMADPVISSVTLIFISYQCYKKYKGDDSHVRGVERSLQGLFNVRQYISTIEAIAEVETTLQDKKYEPYRSDLRSLWVSEIERFSFGSAEITGKTAYEIVDEWIMNCDLDYPYGLVTDQSYAENLEAIYSEVISPKANFFDLNGPLAKFMSLKYQ